MKRTVMEKSLVFVLFVSVIVIFSFAERDTQKIFEKYNTKSTVEIPKMKTAYTAEVSTKQAAKNKAARN
jgi:hypothetical protein